MDLDLAYRLFFIDLPFLIQKKMFIRTSFTELHAKTYMFYVLKIGLNNVRLKSIDFKGIVKMLLVTP